MSSSLTHRRTLTQTPLCLLTQPPLLLLISLVCTAGVEAGSATEVDADAETVRWLQPRHLLCACGRPMYVSFSLAAYFGPNLGRHTSCTILVVRSSQRAVLDKCYDSPSRAPENSAERRCDKGSRPQKTRT